MVKNLEKIRLKVNKYHGSDFIRFIIYKIAQLNFASAFVRKIKLWFYFKSWAIECGENVIITGLPVNIEIGIDLNIYANCVFFFGSESIFRVGTSCLFSYGVIIACIHKIEIGNFVQIGEYTSIRDSTHQYQNVDMPMKFQVDISQEIVIGNDVWIGRGCIIMPGTIIEDGVVVGANSVVKGRLEKFSIYAGSPAKLIKKRNSIV
jgi:acetyltransferase-like isoleucine patch superfamily enzyme